MDTVNLKTASAYLNNLLLARGLLRNGKPIQFARPHKAEGGTEQTMAQIINVVHDMVLRRDREQEQRESLAQTIRLLRTDSADKSTDLQRLENRVAELNRQLVQCQNQERAAAKAAQSAEAAAKSLRDEVQKLKNTVNIVRATCANDVRKRDLQLQRLKSHLTTQQRGSRTAASAMTIVIQPGTTGVVKEITDTSKSKEALDVDDPAYSLKQETTEFLTQLSQSLSDENDNLISLVRTTLATLKGLQGLPENVERLPTIHEVSVREGASSSGVHAPPVAYDVLASDMERVLENLRSILTNPNFVPIEEITVREQEIATLREGWDKMEMKWRETILMMDNWRRRVLSGDDTVNLDEIKRVLGLGRQMNLECGLLDDETVALTDAGDSDVADIFDSSVVEDVSISESTEHSLAVPSPSPVRGRQPLIPAAGNGITRSPKKVAFDIKKTAQHHIVADENISGSERITSKQSDATNRSASPKKSVLVQSNGFNGRPEVQELELNHGVTAVAAQDKVFMYIDHADNGSRSRKRSSSPSAHPEEPAQKLTVQEKLNVAQAEAEAAAAALERDASQVAHDQMATTSNDANVTSRKVRKTGVKGRPRRRKSTLTPDELEQLMFVQ